MKYDCVIVGGGASGLMLAAMMKVNSGVIVESTAAVGNKLMLTGGGRCNVTHAGSIKDFVDCYDEAGRALRRNLYKHNNINMVNWLESIGVPCVVEDDKYYPVSMKASDVRDALVHAAKNNGWTFRHNCKIQSISDLPESDHIVIATGGITFPETGSDGSMFKVLRNLGVEITPLKSALAPIYVKDYPYAELSGVSIPNVTVTAYSSDTVNTCKGKSARITGDLLFTHTGFSGPAILKIAKYCEPGERISINYNCSNERSVPNSPYGQKGPALISLPRRFKKILEDRARGESGDIKTSKLKGLLESDNFIVQSIDNRGMVTSGGIALDQIDLSSMQLKNHPGLYAIGEVLDVDGTTGGYNLQMCYSTAATAADSIMSDLRP